MGRIVDIVHVSAAADLGTPSAGSDTREPTKTLEIHPQSTSLTVRVTTNGEPNFHKLMLILTHELLSPKARPKKDASTVLYKTTSNGVA